MIAAIAALFIWGLKPVIAELRNLRRMRQEAVGLLERSSLQKDYNEALIRSVSQIDRGAIKKLHALFAQAPEFAHLAVLINRNSADSRWLLATLQIAGQDSRTEAASAGPLEDIAVQLQLKGGGYRELKEFLRLTTVSIPMLELTSFTFDPASGGANLNLRMRRISAAALSGGGASPADLEFFETPAFAALRAPYDLPPKDPAGKANPFAPGLGESN